MDADAPLPNRANEPRPILLAVAAALSFAGFAAAGWTVRSLREEKTPPAPTVPIADAASSRDRGRLIYQVQCARCHGSQGHGDGPDSAALRPPPRDLAQHNATRESIRRAVVEGVPNSMMTSFRASLFPREIDAVVDHVLSLAAEASGDPAIPYETLKQAGFTPTIDGRAAPSLDVRDSDGQPLVPDRLRGRLVLVLFGGVGCAPCQKELPDLARLAARFRDERLTIVPLCVDETDPSVARRIAAEQAPGLPVFTDPTGTAKLHFDVQALPSAALIAPDGRLLGQSQGAMSWSTAEMTALIRAGLDAPSLP